MVHLRLSCLDSTLVSQSCPSKSILDALAIGWLGHVAGLLTYRHLLFRFIMAQIKYTGYRIERIYGYLGRKQVCEMQFTAIA
jgi:hypothetical protein